MSLHLRQHLFISYSVTAFPDSPLQCDYGWVAYNRSCYRLFYNRHLNWADAKKSCRDLGGHLVRIDTFDENEFLSNSTRLYFEVQYYNKDFLPQGKNTKESVVLCTQVNI